MLWTAPAPRHRSAIDWLRQNQSESQGGKTRQQRRRLKYEEIGEDRRGNADKIDPGIGTTRLGQRIFECVFLIGTRSAQSIMASGFTAAQTGRTHDRTRPMLQLRQKVLAKAPSTHDPKRTSRSRLQLLAWCARLNSRIFFCGCLYSNQSTGTTIEQVLRSGSDWRFIR